MPTWRSLDEAAAAVGVTKRTLQKWIKGGLLKPYRVLGDRRTFVDLDQIEKLREPQPREPADG
jgi:excisionase family DNA binding protein